jgi:SPP1 gp7 family putative phage head morphogenesis protein
MTRDPIIPSNIRDRTGTAGILRRAIAQINRRFAGLRRDVLAIWDGVRVLEANDAAAMPRTIYAMTPEEMAATSQALRDALDRWIASERDPAHGFWWSVYDQEASQAGAAQSVANLTRLSPAYGATRTLQQVVFSEAYRNRVAMAQLKSYEHWTGLSAGMRSELSQIIGRAVVDGKNPRAVRTEIAERLGVSRAKAAQYAQTDITDTLRQARVAEAEHAEEEFGIRIGLLWTSALIPTTRPWHASRNGKVYSPDEVRAFYAERGNRYNCHCATTECLLDGAGKPILTKRLRETMAGELVTWRKRAGK